MDCQEMAAFVRQFNRRVSLWELIYKGVRKTERSTMER